MNCRTRKVRSTEAGLWRTNSQETIRTSSRAITKPNAGETTMPAAVLATPSKTIAFGPALASPAPIRPPTRACDDDDGMPASQVMVLATCRPKNRKATKLNAAAQATA
jgi:hypothetical protein